MSPNTNPSWADLNRVSENCVEGHKRVTAATLELRSRFDHLSDRYISRQEFEDYQELVTERYGRIAKVVDKVMWTIALGVLAAGLSLLIPLVKH
jgi:hypothetical protein